jgi:hypothetical protein
MIVIGPEMDDVTRPEVGVTGLFVFSTLKNVRQLYAITVFVTQCRFWQSITFEQSWNFAWALMLTKLIDSKSRNGWNAQFKMVDSGHREIQLWPWLSNTCSWLKIGKLILTNGSCLKIKNADDCRIFVCDCWDSSFDFFLSKHFPVYYLYRRCSRT